MRQFKKQNIMRHYIDNFVKTVSKTTNQHAPLKRLSRKKHKLACKPWITKGIYKSIRRKRLMFKTHFMNGSANEKNFYRKYTNKLTKVKALSKKCTLKRN